MAESAIGDAYCRTEGTKVPSVTSFRPGYALLV